MSRPPPELLDWQWLKKTMLVPTIPFGSGMIAYDIPIDVYSTRTWAAVPACP